MSIPTHRFERVSSHIENVFSSLNAPGLAFGVVSKQGQKKIWTLGAANFFSQEPITEQTKFQIGSISKSFTSICLLKFAEQGMLNLNDPIVQHLPWFKIQSQHDPIRLVDLMSHTAGIQSGVDRSLSPLYEVLSLKNSAATTQPGQRFHYSNAGYKALGLVIEAISGKRVDLAIEEEVLAPLGMTRSKAAFTNEDREYLSAGHIPFYDDRPCPTGGKLALAPWFENNCADGSIIAPIDDMTTYARALLNEMNGVITRESFQKLIEARVSTGDGAHGQQYGLGLFLDELWGHHVIGHSGGMVGYSSDMLADLDAGIGVIALTNGDVDASKLTRGALTILVGKELDEEQKPQKYVPIEYLLGSFYNPYGNELAISTAGDENILTFGGERSTLHALGGNKFYAPQFSPIFPIFGLDNADGEPLLVCGEQVFTREPAAPMSISADRSQIDGHYRSYNPWLSNFRIIHRLSKPIMVFPNGDEEDLFSTGEFRFAVGDVRSPESILFGDLHNSVTQSAIFGGQEYNRVFTP